MSILQVEVIDLQAFDSKERREKFAENIAKIFALTSISGEPVVYPVTPTEEYEYVVDQQNNWKVIFDKQNNRRVSFMFRYGDPALEEALARFVAHLYGATSLLYSAV